MTDAEAMLEDCVQRQPKLTEWETGFIKSVIEIGANKLSRRHHERLEQIWERVT